jgi:hypothetical protein
MGLQASFDSWSSSVPALANAGPIAIRVAGPRQLYCAACVWYIDVIRLENWNGPYLSFLKITNARIPPYARGPRKRGPRLHQTGPIGRRPPLVAVFFCSSVHGTRQGAPVPLFAGGEAGQSVTRIAAVTCSMFIKSRIMSCTGSVSPLIFVFVFVTFVSFFLGGVGRGVGEGARLHRYRK